jgi:hypothetical protein
LQTRSLITGNRVDTVAVVEVLVLQLAALNALGDNEFTLRRHDHSTRTA